MTKRLLVFANAFPYGTWEPFLERESEFYDPFDEVIFFSLSVRPEQRKVKRALSDDSMRVVALPFRPAPVYLANAVRLIGNRAYWAELRQLVKDKRFSLSRLVNATVFFSRANLEARGIRKYLKKHVDDKPSDENVLYAYRFFYQPYLMSVLAPMLANPRLVARAHRADLYEDVAPAGYLPYRQGSLDALDYLSLISQHGLHYIEQTLHGYEGRIGVDYLGTEDRELSADPGSRAPLRIVTCSTAVPVKRLNLMVEALALVPAEVEVDWTHIGEGPLLPEVQRQASDLPKNITATFRGALPNQRVLDLYREGAFHALVNVSSSEGLPVSIMEACSFGMPVVATDVGGTSEIVDDRNGFLVPANASPELLAERITDLATMSQRRYSTLRNNARASWAQRFNSATNYEAFVHDRLLGASSQSATTSR